jgi:hypothetical protein
MGRACGDASLEVGPLRNRACRPFAGIRRYALSLRNLEPVSRGLALCASRSTFIASAKRAVASEALHMTIACDIRKGDQSASRLHQRGLIEEGKEER